MSRSDKAEVDAKLSEPAVLVLAALNGEAKHGYAIIGDIERETARRLGPGTLYGILARLESAGLIEPLEMEDRGRVPYRITGTGRRVLSEKMASLQRYQITLRSLAAR